MDKGSDIEQEEGIKTIPKKKKCKKAKLLSEEALQIAVKSREVKGRGEKERYTHLNQFSSVQSLSRVRLFVTPWTAARQASLSITNSRSPPKPMSIESVMPSSRIILCHPLLLPSIFPSIRVFSNESTLCMRWPKYWSFSFNFSHSNELPGLISFRMDWLDLPCSPRYSQESSPTLQFRSINSLVLSFFYGPTLTSIRDHWKNHSLD